MSFLNLKWFAHSAACLTLFMLPSLLFSDTKPQEDLLTHEELERNLPLVEFETTQGKFTVQLLPHAAPKTCENFLGLVKQGYYDETTFHRIIPGFMIQGGDPTGTGRGGQSIWKKPFEDEISPKLTFNEPGILAMANAGPGTNGSQFFITVNPTPWLNGKHTIFGIVVEGYDVVLRIAKMGSSSGMPKHPQKILQARIGYFPELDGE
jgi:peptidylprolyl isomerase